MSYPTHVVLFLLAASLAGCGSSEREESLDPPETIEAPGLRIGASSAQRFGRMGSSSSAESRAPDPQQAFSFALPAGWKTLPSQQFRDVNLEAPGGVNAWVTLMGPGAGGALGNLNRWRSQLGLPPAAEADIAALPTETLLGQSAQRIDLSSPDGAQRLVAVMLFETDRSVFVRISGTPDAVQEQLPGFATFLASLADRRGSEPAAAPEGSADPGGAGDFRWSTPSGWSPVGGSPFKLYEYAVADAKCWVSELAGDGGGLLANVVRWCGQVGIEPLAESEINALPRMQVLGQESVYVRLLQDGDAPGMLGVIVALGDRTLFVKMTGPSRLLVEQGPGFESFCRSFSRKG
ncbi:MAG: hypothetical protein ACO3UM_12750 [Planctomycetota bacterium]